MIQEGIPLPAVKVRKTAGTYEVIDGNHRVTIARQLELETAPAIISSQANP
jgi:ParB-like chromosome segregation protein Spo0J